MWKKSLTITEMKALLQMALARLDAPPTTAVEWDAIDGAVRQVAATATRESVLATDAEKKSARRAAR